LRLDADGPVRHHAVVTPTHPLLPHGDFALALASRLAEVAREHALDVIHVHYALPLAVSAHLARELLGRPTPRLVTTVHGTDVLTLGQEPAFQPLVALALKASDAVTAPTRFLADATAKHFGLGPSVVDVIPNFVDSNLFSPGLKVVNQRKTLVHNSNFRSIKRVQDAVAIFSSVRRFVDCDLVLIGDGPDKDAIEQLVEAYDLTPYVHFAGQQRNVIDLLQHAAVFLMPSELESFGLAALEAMSCGVPVVASAVGGLVELIQQGVTGFLHPVGDVEAMAVSTRRLLENPSLHASMSQAARADAISRWKPERAIEAYEAVYQRLMRSTA
jgi:N-acetyl-alpha-D-glucosaminyl L-malate synthase BshA